MAEEEACTALLTATEEPSPLRALWMGLGKTLLAALPVAGIVLGAVYRGQCPRQPLIPIYLMVLGAAVLLLLFLSCVAPGGAVGTRQPGTLASRLHAACLFFLCAWFIAGNVWVYTAYPPDYESPGRHDFCQRALFLFAFGITTAVHAALAAALLLALCILAGAFALDAVLPRGGHGSRGAPKQQRLLLDPGFA